MKEQMNQEQGVSRKECEALAGAHYSSKGDDSKGGYIVGTLKRLARAHLALLDRIEAAEHTIRVLSDSKIGNALVAGLEDIQAGRVKSLSCVEGGCERRALLDECENLRRDKERLEKELDAYYKHHSG